MYALMLLLIAVSGESRDFRPVPLETPPFQYTLNSRAFAHYTLEEIHRSENRVTDYESWFDRIPAWYAVTYHNGGVNDAIRGNTPPSGVPEVIRVPGDDMFYLYMLIFDEEKNLAFYGDPPNRFDVVLHPRYLMILDFYTFQPERLLDFLTYASGPANEEGELDFVFQQLRWADIDNGVLYVSTAHRTYASSSGGLNAYITAIDLETLELLWRSRPLVSNSSNFLIAGDTIVSGYGFTDEEDYIYLLDRLTGEVMESYAVPSAPEYLYLDEDLLYVRCYDCDITYRMVRSG